MQYRGPSGEAVGHREVIDSGYPQPYDSHPELNRAAEPYSDTDHHYMSEVHVTSLGDAHWLTRAEHRTARHARYARWFDTVMRTFAYASPEFVAWCYQERHAGK